MPSSETPSPQFVADLRIAMSVEFSFYEQQDINWRKFINSSDATTAKTPLELACKAFIDMLLSPELDAEKNDYPARICTVLFAFLAHQYGRYVSRDQGKELWRRWVHYRSGASKLGTKPIRDWFDEAFGKESWPRRRELF